MQQSQEKIIYTQAEDGIELAGLSIVPARLASAAAPTIVWIHGNTSNFYDSAYVSIGRHIAARGYAFISGNTRGHDISATLWNEKQDTLMAGGSAWELLEESPHDLAAWVNKASLGEKREVILVGHSLGAAKVIYYQALRQDRRLRGLVLASPDLRGHVPEKYTLAARRLLRKKHGEHTLPPLMGAPWYRLSAQNVVSRAAMQAKVFQRRRGLPHLSHINTPILAFFGTQGDIGGEHELLSLKENAHSATRLDTVIIPGSDHIYSDSADKVALTIVKWLETLPTR